MTSSLSSLFDNLDEAIHKIKCKYGHDDKKCKTCGIKYKHCKCFLEYTNFKDNLIDTNVYVVTRIIKKSLIKISGNDFLMHTSFLTMISISLFYCCEKVCPYKYVDDWKKINKTLLPEKEDFYSCLK